MCDAGLAVHLVEVIADDPVRDREPSGDLLVRRAADGELSAQTLPDLPSVILDSLLASGPRSGYSLATRTCLLTRG